MGSTEEERLLLEDGLIENDSRGPYAGDGSVDINGKPVLKQNTGNWRACQFILGTECCERFAYCGISANLVTYLTNKLHEGNVSAARNVTTWSGTCSLAPLIGAVLADSYWGRYWTIAVFCTIYFIGMGTLTMSASVPAFRPPPCVDSVCPAATPPQYAIFFSGLYLIALGTGGIKPCVSSFGADQFDDTDPRERVMKGSFFNWFYLCINLGALISSSFLVWIQDNAGWGLGFGIPTLFVGISIIIFFSATPLYRFQKPGGSPLARMCQVVVASIRKWNLEVPQDSFLLYELPDNTSAIEGSRKLEHSDEFKFLDKAASVSDVDVKQGNFSNPWRLCTVTQVEELKILMRMIPIWSTGIVFFSVYAQMSTLFVEQGMVMDTSIGSFTIPPASLLTFDIISVIVWVPMYDRFLVPLARKFTDRRVPSLLPNPPKLLLIVTCMGSLEDERLLLEDGILENGSRGQYTGDGPVDINGKPLLKQNTGNWRACQFILGTAFFESLAISGIQADLVTYLTRKLHEGNVSAARSVTTWSGTCSLAPLIGAVLADSYWGRYWTIAFFSTIYFIGMCTLTLSASVPAFSPPPCLGSVCPAAIPAQYAILFCGLYLIALGTGGMDSCVSSFGADQFDDTDPRERVKKASYFNWYYLTANIGALISSTFLIWIQENAGWGLGFGIATLFMGLSIVNFYSGRPSYRFQDPGGSPLTRMCQVVVASIKKWNLEVPQDSFLLYELGDQNSEIEGRRKLEHSDEFKCLDKAAVVSDLDVKQRDFNPWRLCTVTQCYSVQMQEGTLGSSKQDVLLLLNTPNTYIVHMAMRF
ncbi:hypothetical protein NE237_007912 [Protea cynaroides]|uniref:Peptide transporter n=1 Tax=Protea cynaroides TaxID=273540 RepID=A0A9Q0KQ32_9MAGN|nr:hypothetical protein NE237_007912 [Protea cynaroides]